MVDMIPSITSKAAGDFGGLTVRGFRRGKCKWLASVNVIQRAD